MTTTITKYLDWLAAAALALLFFVWYFVLSNAPPDAQQGMVYKLIYIHVPAAAVALGLMSLILLITSFVGLLRPTAAILSVQRAAVEVGLLFTALTLITGSIWGKPTWGTWWTWDARLTTTLLLAILQSAYLLVLQSLPSGSKRTRICSILGLIICVDVPIIYQSVEWWRGLHQPAALIPERGRNMDPEMLNLLLLSLFAMIIYATLVWMTRLTNLLRRDEIDAAIERSLR
jgi:heme exporter protein C